jgi:hypothetical protein
LFQKNRNLEGNGSIGSVNATARQYSNKIIWVPQLTIRIDDNYSENKDSEAILKVKSVEK